MINTCCKNEIYSNIILIFTELFIAILFFLMIKYISHKSLEMFGKRYSDDIIQMEQKCFFKIVLKI